MTNPHYEVAKAKREGRLAPKPCTKCGTKRNPCAHHPDYTKPLKVVWFCNKCHIEHHSDLEHAERLGVDVKDYLRVALERFCDDEGMICTGDLIGGLGLGQQTVLNKYMWPGRQAGLLLLPAKRKIDKTTGRLTTTRYFKVKGCPK